MTQEVSENYSEIEIKEELYMLYLEIKEELTKKNIEIEKEQIEEAINTTKINTIINYIREMVYILIHTKLDNNIEEKNMNKNTNTNNRDSDLSQLENNIRKLEYDIKYLLQKEFQNKIKRDALEMKLNSYMEIESEYEELKEKVKYEGGKFLNNERKDNEIIILRQENGILKKEIEKHEINNKKYETKIKSEEEIIQDLKGQINLLNQKVSNLELLSSQKDANNQSNTNNSSINININNNGNSSSKWIIKQENQDSHNYNNLNNNSNSSSFSNFGLKKRKINNFQKNNTQYSSNCLSNNKGSCNFNVGTRYTRYGQGRDYNRFQGKNNKANGMNTIDNNNAFTATYSKILNNLCVKENKSPNKRENKNKKNNNSISMYIEEYDKSVMENKYISNKRKKFNSNKKNNNGYNKIIGLIPNSRFPLSGKNQLVKKSNVHSLPKKLLHKDKNTASYSSLILNRK